MGGRCGTVWSVCLCSEACAGRGGARDGASALSSAERREREAYGICGRAMPLKNGPRRWQRGRLRWSRGPSFYLRIKWSKTGVFLRSGLAPTTAPCEHQEHVERCGGPYASLCLSSIPEISLSGPEAVVACAAALARIYALLALPVDSITVLHATIAHARAADGTSPRRWRICAVAQGARIIGRTYHVTRARRGHLLVPPECACVAPRADDCLWHGRAPGLGPRDVPLGQ